jgi:Spy/CpxP family protein refolding chaperone
MLDQVASKAAAGGMNLKRMKYLTVALGGVLFLGMSAAAVAQNPSSPAQAPNQSQSGQPQPPQPMTMDQRMARLTQVLNLTTAQQQQIRPILEQAQQKMQALAADNATPMADRQAQAETIRNNVRSQIDAVLTDEQKQKVEAMSHQGPGGPGSGAPPAQPQSQPQR